MSKERFRDLWPESLRVDVVTPFAIIKAQATKLKERTQGILEGYITTNDVPPGLLCHSFDLYAPQLRFTYTLFNLWHRTEMIYPVVIFGGEEKPPDPATIEACLSGKMQLADRVPLTDEESINRTLESVFSRHGTKTTILSLIARSNEIRGWMPPEMTEATQEPHGNSPEPTSEESEASEDEAPDGAA